MTLISNWSFKSVVRLFPYFTMTVVAMTVAFAATPLAGFIAEYLHVSAKLGVMPVVLMILTVAICSLFQGKLYAALPGRLYFAVSALTGMVAFLSIYYGLKESARVLVVAGFILLGFMQAGLQFTRFAAAEIVDKPLKATVVTCFSVMGLLGALAGPAFASGGHFVPTDPNYSATPGLLIAALALVCGVLTHHVSSAKKDHAQGDSPQKFLSGLTPSLAAAAASFGMATVMVSAPYAASLCGLAKPAIAGAFQVHYLFMFTPALFLSKVMNRFGTTLLTNIGLILLIISGVTASLASSQPLILAALAISGLGWCLTVNASTFEIVRNPTTNKGLYQFTINLGSAGGTLAAGLAFDLGQWHAVGIVTCVVSGGCLLGVLIAKHVKSHHVRNAEDSSARAA